MRVDAILFPRDLSECDLSNTLAVVVDIFRATSTIITAIHNGAKEVVPFKETEEVEERALDYPAGQALKCGERNGYTYSGFDLGNSPLEYNRDLIYNKTILFSSTNGSQLFSKIQSARKVIIGGFLNIERVVNSIIQNKQDCLIACAGNYGNISIEDSVYAGMILAMIKKNGVIIEMNDEARVSMILYQYYQDDFQSIMRESSHGRHLSSIGKEEDMKFCLQVNTVDCLPVYNGQTIIKGPEKINEHG